MRYRDLSRVPFFVAAGVGRVGIAASALAVVLLVQHRTGSFAAAGLVAGCFAAAEAVAGPQMARLIDRYGQTRVLPPLLLGHAAAAGLLLAAGPRWMPPVAGVLLGATIPQLGALSATRWAALLDSEALPAAFALESLANSAAFLVGPVLVSAIAATGHPVLCPAVAAGLIVVGGLWLAALRGTAPPPAGRVRRAGTGGTLLRPAFLTLAGLNAALGVFFGAVPVAVTAFTIERHRGYAVTALFAMSSGASLLGGWLYGRRPRRLGFATVGALMALGGVLLALASAPFGGPSRAAALSLAGDGLAFAGDGLPLAGDGLAFAGDGLRLAGDGLASAGDGLLLTGDGWPGGVLLVGAGLVLTGLVVPVILVLSNVRTTLIVERAVLTQAYTWLNTASVAGSAAASSATGWAVDHGGAADGLLVAAAATAAVALLAAAARRR
ncbi:MFS transporter [Actinoplanes sp. NPDC049265]|uniref:MFS transporter n=1 Tax=Actinoplanes sp. NPDC049265 TaxID=3363902 RepID=UPI00372352C3